ncbi:MAG: hypothetical protein HY720_27220, partial [Planctomycetes bacterium]|nr:hypothetical protein [Planctomycetota bacterium]
NTVRLWDGETGRPIATLEGHQGLVASIAFSPDGKRLASGSLDTTIRLWNLETILAPPDELKTIVEEITGMTLRGIEVVPKED